MNDWLFYGLAIAYAVGILGLLLLAAFLEPLPPSRRCSECGRPLRRREVVQHFLAFHNSPTRSPR